MSNDLLFMFQNPGSEYGLQGSRWAGFETPWRGTRGCAEGSPWRVVGGIVEPAFRVLLSAPIWKEIVAVAAISKTIPLVLNPSVRGLGTE